MISGTGMRFYLVIALTALLLSACAAGGGSDQPPVGDGDLAEFEQPFETCETSADCKTGEICEAGRCYAPQVDGDGCTSSFDCPAGLRCDTANGTCYDPNADGDLEPDAPADGDDDIPAEQDETPDGDIEEDSPPSPVQVSFVRPLNGDVVDGTVNILVEAQSEADPVDFVEVLAYGEALGALDSEPYAIAWDCSEKEAAANVEIRATAHAGNDEGRAAIYVTVDHTPPEISISEPAEGFVYGYFEPVRITLEAGDHLAELRLYLDDAETPFFVDDQPDASGSYSYNFEPGDFGPGAHTLTAEALDRVAGHAAASASVGFRMDDLPPELIVDGPEWDGDQGEMLAETPLVLRVLDPSGVKSLDLRIRDARTTVSLLALDLDDFTSARAGDDLVYTLASVNDILVQSNNMYPAPLNITGSIIDNLDNELTVDLAFNVKRIIWTYDAIAASATLDPPVGHLQKSGAAADAGGNLYAVFVNELHAIAPDGSPRFIQPLGGTVSHTPVVTDIDGYGPVVLMLDGNGRILVRPAGATPLGLIAHLPEESLIATSAPVVESAEATTGGFEMVFYFCTRKIGDSRCFKYRLNHTDPEALRRMVRIDGDLDDESDTDAEAEEELPVGVNVFERLWARTISGEYSPSNMLLPRDMFSEPIVGIGKKILRLNDETGSELPGSWPHITEKIHTISAIPGKNVIAVSSENYLRVYSYTLQNRTSFYPLTGAPDDRFLEAQIVSGNSGTPVVMYMKDQGGIVRAVIETLDIGSDGIVGYPWSYTLLSGVPGGSPVVGQGDILYAAGSSQYGTVWALDINEVPAVGESKVPLWQARLNEPVLAPLLISTNGDMVAVSATYKIMAVDIKGQAPLGQESWSMDQGQAQRSGHFWP